RRRGDAGHPANCWSVGLHTKERKTWRDYRRKPRALIENALASLLDPRQDAESLSRYFASDYIQDVDGKRLDFNGFIDHARTLKKSLRGGRVTIENIIVDGMTIADVHVVDAEKTNADTIPANVIPFYTVRHANIF